MSHRIRQTEPRDLPLLWAIARAQNRRDATNYPVPSIFDLNEASPTFGQMVQNVPLALTTERDGRVRGVTIFLRTIEVMSFIAGREDMEFSAAHIPMALEQLKRRGYTEAHTFVPHVRLSEAHCKLLTDYGMQRIDPRLAHFFQEF